MNKKETKIIVSRIEQWYSRMLGYFVEDRTPLTAKYGWSKDAVPFFDRNRLYGALGYIFRKGLKMQFGMMRQTSNSFGKNQLQLSLHQTF